MREEMKIIESHIKGEIMEEHKEVESFKDKVSVKKETKKPRLTLKILLSKLELLEQKVDRLVATGSFISTEDNDEEKKNRAIVENGGVKYGE